MSHCSDHTYALPDKKDYHAEKYGKPALYTRNQFKQDLKEIIMEKRPEIILQLQNMTDMGITVVWYFLLKRF